MPITNDPFGLFGAGGQQVLATASAAGQLSDRGKALLAKAQAGDYSWMADATPQDLEAYRGAAAQAQTDAARRALNTGSGYVPQDPPSAAELQRQALGAKRDAQYGNDMAWLDPSFQYKPELLGTAAGASAAADPNAIANQNAAMSTAQQFANQNLQFQSPAQQQALMQQWAAIQGGQGAPTFMGNSQQQQIMQGLLGVAAPRFQGDGTQRQVLNQALGLGTNTGPGSLQFDTSGRQGEQYGNLQGIIAGGGANAIEMAQRARARADSEAWLRGQREADMADYAERGLTGSGMELLNLAADRQAAAGRNSMSDLQTSADLEKRRLDAINAASGLATNMRGQTIDEQGLLNNRAVAGLGAASSLANSMRSADIQEQLGLSQAEQAKYLGAAGIAGTMRGQDYQERTYGDQRAINALGQQTDLSNKMRDQTANEQIANQNAKQAGLNTLAQTANSARSQSAQEAQYRADATDLFSRLNQSAINAANSSNTQFLQNAYTNTMANRQNWALNELNQNVAGATGQIAGDRADNNAGYTQGTNLGISDTNTFNETLNKLRDQILGIFQGGQTAQADAKKDEGAAAGQIAGNATSAGGTAVGAIIGGAGAGATTGGATAAQGAQTGAAVGSQAALTKTAAQTEEERRRSTLLGGG